MSELRGTSCSLTGVTYLNQNLGHPLQTSLCPGSAHTAGMTPVSQAVLASHWSSGAEEPG